MDVRREQQFGRNILRVLQYCNTQEHKKFLSAIVATDLPRVKRLLESALAIFIRIDGNVDRFQLYSKLMMAKVDRAGESMNTGEKDRSYWNSNSQNQSNEVHRP